MNLKDFAVTVLALAVSSFIFYVLFSYLPSAGHPQVVFVQPESGSNQSSESPAIVVVGATHQPHNPVNVMAVETITMPQIMIDSFPPDHPAQSSSPVPTNTAINLVPYSACQNTRLYSTTSDGDEYYIGFIPQGTTIYLEAQSSDGLWVRLYSSGAATEWWTSVANVCS